MTPSRIISLCCLPALCIPSASNVFADAEASLIVGPGETLVLEAPEAGVELEAALGGGPLKPLAECSPAGGCTLEAPASGDHWLAVAGRDRAGNLSPLRWVRLRVDSEPPRVELEPSPAPVNRDRRWMPPRSTVTASAADDLAGVTRLFLAAGEEIEEVAEPSGVIELPLSSEVTVRAWALDDAGNRSAETTLDLAIDSTPPVVEIRPACQPSPHNTATVVVAPDCRIAVEVRDGDSGVAEWTPAIDGEGATVEGLTGPWTAGLHAIEVTALDAVGNRARVGPFAFVADAAGPEIAWRVSSEGAQGAGGETFYRPPVTVTVAAEDSPAGLDRLSASTGASHEPIAGSLEVDGDRLLLRAVDGVGNVSEVEAKWRLDIAPPEIYLETDGGDAVSPGSTLELERGASVRFRTVDEGAGVESATYSLRVESADILRHWWWWPPLDEPLPERLVFPWAGELELSVEAVDRLGNRRKVRWHVVVRPKKGGSS